MSNITNKEDDRFSLEQFNGHQRALNERYLSVVKSIFLLSGGTLSISIGFFTNTKTLNLARNISDILSWSWGLLFLSIILLTIAISATVLRDYLFGEKWREKIDKKRTSESVTSNTCLEKIVLIASILGISLFILGFGAQAFAAINLVSIATVLLP